MNNNFSKNFSSNNDEKTSEIKIINDKTFIIENIIKKKLLLYLYIKSIFTKFKSNLKSNNFIIETIIHSFKIFK